jgi:aldose 1-epimerase
MNFSTFFMAIRITMLATLMLFSFIATDARPSVTKASFGKMPDGAAVDIYTLTNSKGMEARVIAYGGEIVSLKTPDRNGRFDDVVLGYDTLEAYLAEKTYIGALIGRYGNRIAKGKFTLNGKEYSLARNNGENHLHGGLKGFDKVVWTVGKTSTDKNGASIVLTYFSKDGEEGYPGNLTVKVVYTVTENNELKIDYFATADKDTVVNLTQHSYFNLAGPASQDILNHVLYINADKFTPTDATSIPTGFLQPVKGTPMDFNIPTAIGRRIEQDDRQLKWALGYDHNWVLNKGGTEPSLAARVTEPTSGRVMEVLTTEPGIQFYSGNYLDGTETGKGSRVHKKRLAFCLETQHYPDSPNHPDFPTTVLKKGQKYATTTIYRFSAK